MSRLDTDYEPSESEIFDEEEEKKIQLDNELYHATEQGDFLKVKTMLEQYPDLDAEEALLEACYYKYFDIIKYIIENKDIGKYTLGEAVASAALGGSLDIVKYLVTHNGKIKDKAVINSIREGHLPILKYFIEQGVNIDETHVYTSVEKNQLDILKFILENYKIDIHFDNEKLLIEASNKGFFDIVKYLVENGADYKNKIALNEAKKYNYLNIVEYLVNYGKETPFTTVNSECDASKLNDNHIEKIAEILNLDKNINKLSLCKQISEVFHKKAEEIKTEIPQCTNTTTVLLEDFSDIHPMYFYSYSEGDKLFCDDIRELVKMKANPWTKTPFNKQLINDINMQFEKLTLLIKHLDDNTNDINLDMSITNTIRSVTNKVLSQLRYPKDGELYVNSDMETLNRFIDKLYEENIFTLNDKNQIGKITTLENKKLTVMNTLILKLEVDTQFTEVNGSRVSALRVMLEEVYNQIF